MASLGTLSVTIAANADKLSATLKNTQKQLKGWSKNTLSVIEQNSAAITGLGIVFAGVGTAIAGMSAGAVKTFASFEQAMKNVQSVSNATGEEFDRLSEHAKSLGESTVFTARESAEAMYFLGSAGLSAAQQIQATGPILDLAAATQSNLADTTRLAVSALKAFKIPTEDADRVTNVFAATISSSQATLEKLSTSMPYVATTFNLLGYSVEEASGALGILYDNGLEASMAGTRLRSAINKLLDPTDKATAAIQALGINVEDVNPATNSLVEIVGEFERAGLDAASAAQIFGQRAEGMTILANTGAEALQNMIDGVTGTNRAAEMAATQLDTLIGDMKLLKSAAEGAAINFGEQLAPAIRGVISNVTELISWFNQLSPSTQGVIARLTALTGAASLVTGAGLILIAQLPKIAAGFAALKMLTASLPAVITPVVAGLAALATSAWGVKRAVDAWQDPMVNIKGQLKALTNENKQAYAAVVKIREAMETWQGSVSSMTIGDLGLDAEKLSKQIGFIVKPTTDAYQVLDILEKSITDNIAKGKELKDKLTGDGGLADAETTIKKITDDLTKTMAGLAGTVDNATTQVASGLSEIDAAISAGAQSRNEQIEENMAVMAASIKSALGNIVEDTQKAEDNLNKAIGEGAASRQKMVDASLDKWDKSIEAALANMYDDLVKAKEEEEQWLTDFHARTATLEEKDYEDKTARAEKFREEEKVRKEKERQEKEAWDIQNTENKRREKEREYQVILQFQANVLDSYDGHLGLLEGKYQKIFDLYEKNNRDTTEVVEAYNKAKAELNRSYLTDLTSTTSRGLNDIMDAWDMLYSFLGKKDDEDADLKDNSLRRMMDWVANSISMLDTLVNAWQSALQIISAIQKAISAAEGISSASGLLSGAGLAGLGIGLGPLAAGAIGAGFLMKMMWGGSRDKYKSYQGGGYVTEEGLAYVHSGERIETTQGPQANQAAQFGMSTEETTRFQQVLSELTYVLEEAQYKFTDMANAVLLYNEQLSQQNALTAEIQNQITESVSSTLDERLAKLTESNATELKNIAKHDELILKQLADKTVKKREQETKYLTDKQKEREVFDKVEDARLATQLDTAGGFEKALATIDAEANAAAITRTQEFMVQSDQMRQQERQDTQTWQQNTQWDLQQAMGREESIINTSHENVLESYQSHKKMLDEEYAALADLSHVYGLRITEITTENLTRQFEAWKDHLANLQIYVDVALQVIENEWEHLFEVRWRLDHEDEMLIQRAIERMRRWVAESERLLDRLVDSWQRAAEEIAEAREEMQGEKKGQGWSLNTRGPRKGAASGSLSLLLSGPGDDYVFSNWKTYHQGGYVSEPLIAALSPGERVLSPFQTQQQPVVVQMPDQIQRPPMDVHLHLDGPVILDQYGVDELSDKVRASLAERGMWRD